MQFEVNGTQYFLNFVEDESQWFVFEPTLTGINRIPVYVDGARQDRFGVPHERNSNRKPN